MFLTSLQLFNTIDTREREISLPSEIEVDWSLSDTLSASFPSAPEYAKMK